MGILYSFIFVGRSFDSYIYMNICDQVTNVTYTSLHVYMYITSAIKLQMLHMRCYPLFVPYTCEMPAAACHKFLHFKSSKWIVCVKLILMYLITFKLIHHIVHLFGAGRVEWPRWLLKWQGWHLGITNSGSRVIMVTPLEATRAPSQYKDRLIYVWRFPC